MIFVMNLRFWYYGLDSGPCNFVLGYQIWSFSLNLQNPVPFIKKIITTVSSYNAWYTDTKLGNCSLAWINDETPQEEGL